MMIKNSKTLLSLLLCSLIWPLTAVAEEELLAPEVAFRFSAEAKDATTVRAGWELADGYYLYQKKIKFSTDTPGVRLGKYELPAGKVKQDEFFGRVEIYYHAVKLDIPVILEDPAVTSFQLIAQSQGCADLGVCYPPQKQTVTIALPTTAATPGVAAINSLGSSLGLGNEDDILEPDQAFQFSSEYTTPDTIILRWDIAPEHYLYRDKMKFKLIDTRGVSLGEISLPTGEIKQDQFFGKIAVYHDHVEAKINLLRTAAEATSIKLQATYQGCAESTGICYPPINKMIALDLPPSSNVVTSLPATAEASPLDTPTEEASTAPMSDAESFSKTLTEGNLIQVILAAFGFGILLAFTACMYPMIPILSSIIVGQGEKATVARSFGLSLVYVEALAITFAVVGSIIGGFSDTIGIQALFQKPVFLIPFSLLFVALAFSMFGFYNIQMPSGIQSRLNAISNQQQGGTLLGVFFMGVLSALIIGPCGGPILIAALSYAATAGPVKGAIALFALGNGMGLPLLVIGASGGKLLPKAGGWMNIVKAVAGVVLLAVAIVFLERMPDIFSPLVTMLLWSLLFIASGIYMGALEPLAIESTGWHKFWKGLGLFLILYGIFVMIGGLSGARDFTNPLHGSQLLGSRVPMSASLSGTAASHGQQVKHFKRIKSVAELEQELATAGASGKPVMLDFYADWCTYCLTYEEYVFPDPAVQDALENYVLLQADVTATDAEDKALMKHVGVLLPPAILFFDTQGNEQRSSRVVGAMKAKEFSAHVKRATKAMQN